MYFLIKVLCENATTFGLENVEELRWETLIIIPNCLFKLDP